MLSVLTQTEMTKLKFLAEESIQYGLNNHKPPSIELDCYPDNLTEHKASFVTLKINNNLRGCIGSLEAYRPLVVDVTNNAYSAAFKDPRFPSLVKREFHQLEYHISILSQPKSMQVRDENDLYAQLQPNIDGIVLQEGSHRSTFLPCVWESLTTPSDFIEQLKLKAGLDKHYWSDTIKFKRYHVNEF